MAFPGCYFLCLLGVKQVFENYLCKHHVYVKSFMRLVQPCPMYVSPNPYKGGKCKLSATRSCYFTFRLNLLRACMHFVIGRLSVLLTNNIFFLQFWWIDVLKFLQSLDSFDLTETQSTHTWVFKKQNLRQGEHFNTVSERNLGPYNTPEKAYLMSIHAHWVWTCSCE